MWRNNRRLTGDVSYFVNNLASYTHVDVGFIHKALALVKSNDSENVSAINRITQILVDQKVDAVIVISFLFAPILWEQSISCRDINNSQAPCFEKYSEKYFAVAVEAANVSVLGDFRLTIMLIAFVLLDLESTPNCEHSCNIKRADEILCYVVRIGLRSIVHTVPECYGMLGVLRAHFYPVLQHIGSINGES